MNVLVSVIIPVYNREKYLRECVMSVLGQSIEEIEIILVDDGSEDSSPLICCQLGEEYPEKIVFVQSEHGGVSATRNLALDMARGEFVFFLDSDDVIHPLLVEALVRGLQENNADMAGTDVRNVPQRRWEEIYSRISEDNGPAEVSFLNHPEALAAVFNSRTPLSVVGGVMIRKAFIGETRFRTDLYIGEDFYFIYENLIKGSSVVFLRQVWYYCRLHDENSSWDFEYTGFKNRLYRRQLVWENEERMGRQEYANSQKRAVLGCYTSCIAKCKKDSDSKRKIQKEMREYKNVLLPAYKMTGKMRFLLAVYFPSLYNRLYHVYFKLKKRRHQ